MAVGATAVVATIYVARKWTARRDVSPDDHGNSAAIAEVEVVPSSVVQIAEEPVEIEGPAAAVDPKMDVESVPEEAGEEEGAVSGPVEIVTPTQFQEVNNEQQGARPKQRRKSKKNFLARQKERQEKEAAAKLAATFESPSMAEVELAPSVQVAAAVDPEAEIDVAEPEIAVSELEVAAAAAEVAVIAAEVAVAEPDLAVAEPDLAVAAAQVAVAEPEVARAVAEAAVAAEKAAIAATQVAAPEIESPPMAEVELALSVHVEAAAAVDPETEMNAPQVLVISVADEVVPVPDEVDPAVIAAEDAVASTDYGYEFADEVSYASEAHFFGEENLLRDDNFDDYADVLLILTDVDPCYYGRIVGRAGHNIQRLQYVYGVDIQVPPYIEPGNMEGPRFVVISGGERANRQAAYEDIMNNIVRRDNSHQSH